MTLREWFQPVGMVVAVVAVVGVAVGFGSAAALAPPAASPGTSSPAIPTHYVNLTIVINTTNGAPQFVPANVTVPAGRVVFRIVDHDSPSAWAGCGCVVSGTIGSVEWINGTAYHVVPNRNVAHTFTDPRLNLNVLSPGDSTVTFSTIVAPGTYPWWCMAPCGSDGMMGFPMDVPGYMAGTITVTA
ncbi:MAG: hypothetical protein QXG65_01415 [Thermoplasmata archaeon]